MGDDCGRRLWELTLKSFCGRRLWKASVGGLEVVNRFVGNRACLKMKFACVLSGL